jgi:hypothetical protein
LAATASFSALFTVSQRLRAAYRVERLIALSEQAVALSGSLQRSLRALGLVAVVPGDTGEDPGPEAVADVLARYGGRRKEVSTDGTDDAEGNAASTQ